MKIHPSTRERLLHTAIKLFAEKGYAATSVQDIVDAAHLAKPALYYYFKNKEELYLAILSHGFEERLRIMRESFDQKAEWKMRLVDYVRGVIQFSKKQRALCRFAFQASFAPLKEIRARVPIRKMAHRNFQYLKTFFTQGKHEGFFRNLDSHTLALALHGHILSYIFLLSLKSSLAPKKISAETIVDLFLQGASNPRRST